MEEPPAGRGSPLAWAAHPATVGAAVVLAVNDHLLKAAFPGVVTGKLSDVAGLVLAPALLALCLGLLGWNGSRAAAFAVAVTGVGFTLAKATDTGAAVASHAWAAVVGPSLVRADPTDLLALPALALSWFVHLRTRDAGARWTRAARVALAVPFVVLATAATSVDDRSVTAAQAVPVNGEIIVGGGGGYVATEDGFTWRWVSTEQAYAALAGTPPPDCLPSDPAHCYRVVPHRLAVQETTDGHVWKTVWEISPGRADFLRRENAVGRDPAMFSHSLAVLEHPDGYHIVVVANGDDGIALRNARGSWKRLGTPHLISVKTPTTPPTPDATLPTSPPSTTPPTDARPTRAPTTVVPTTAVAVPPTDLPVAVVPTTDVTAPPTVAPPTGTPGAGVALPPTGPPSTGTPGAGVGVPPSFGESPTAGGPEASVSPTPVEFAVAPVEEWRLNPLTDGSAYRYRALFAGLLVFALAAPAALGPLRPLRWGTPLTLIGASLGLALHSLDLAGILVGPFMLGFLIAGLTLLVMAIFQYLEGVEPLRGLAFALGGSVLTPVPILAWTRGAPDDFRDAALFAVFLGCVTVVSAYLVRKPPRLRGRKAEPG
ncbi:hypothetical protein LO762_15150 [Actinocorallia sp. API 0066]|uniref:hypothetical protein n=1 Tax=Actinocorallia sp. API 0066 TaxID=2896846 RepID=UPI001E381578|nr:hypothetical protein [Actinocorallia sp. API 0066]MCD0450516.1 hypothetical protein [Actinocorallia sp. API 0066]